MKTIIIALAFLLWIDHATAQTKLPDTFINVGIGIGGNYGLCGTKTVVGFKNSGLMVGLGRSRSGYPVYQLGGQISYKWAYATLSYGGLVRERDRDDAPIVSGANLMFGSMISLGKSKRCFIDLAIGQYLNTYSNNETVGNSWAESLNAAVGFGYRLGNRANVFE
ncbi:MAG TPA: hypothetical protein VJ184_03955 [Chryseolinea sp.]|nr:hypothetical protein [Chryseolinea sp.]